MGSIRKKKGRWYYRWYDELLKRHEVALDTDNEEVAKRRAERYDIEVDNLNNPSRISKSTFEILKNDYFSFIFPQKSQRIRNEYTYIAKRFSSLDKLPVRKILPQTIVTLLSGLEQKGLKVETRRKTLLILNMILKWGLKKGYIISNPAEDIKLHKSKRTVEKKYFDEEQLVTIFEKADEMYPEISDIFRFLYYTGLRRSELLSLKWEDVDLKRQILHVRESKSEHGYRHIPLRKEAIQILETLPHESEWIFIHVSFGKPWNKDHLSRCFKKVLLRCKIPNLKLHSLRHTFATHLVMRGITTDMISDLLGHSSVLITEVYAQLPPVTLETAILSLPTISKKEKA
jgi:integrase